MAEFKNPKLKGKFKYALSVSPLDCMGCGVCVGVCPTKSLEMVPAESCLEEQKSFNYMVEKVTVKPEVVESEQSSIAQVLAPSIAKIERGQLSSVMNASYAAS